MEPKRSWWQNIKQHRLAIGVVAIVLLVAVALIIIIPYLGWGWETSFWNWIGFNGGYPKITTTNTVPRTTIAIEQPAAKTLWDWLQLFIIPVILVVAGFLLSQVQKDREKKAADRREKIENYIATENQQEAALQEYFDRLTELLLKEHSNESELDKIPILARTRTLTILPRLNESRKRVILQFLFESRYISKDKLFIRLEGADLSKARLDSIDLNNTVLYKTILSEANLKSAITMPTFQKQTYTALS